MVLILLSTLFLSIVNFGFGFLCEKILKTNTQSIALISMLGVMSITLIETVLAFFIPLSWIVETAIISIGFFGFFISIFRENLISDLRKILDVKFFILLIFTAFAGSFTPYLFDHYSYYVPTISVLSEFGFVKGISNLDLVLGQTSLWHIYSAGFSHFADPFLRVNVYLMALFLIYIFEGKHWSLLLFVPCFLIFTPQPNSDLPVFVLTLISLNEALHKKNNIVLLYFSLFAFCIKPIIFWLPLFFILNWIVSKKFKITMSIPILLFGILFVFKNLYLFGFPVYPVSFPNLNLPWKPDENILQYASQIGQIKSTDMDINYKDLLKFNLSEKIYYWFSISYSYFINVGLMICLIVLGVISYFKKQKIYWILWFCLVIKSFFVILFFLRFRLYSEIFLVALFLILYGIRKSSAVNLSIAFSLIILLLLSSPKLINTYFSHYRSVNFMTQFELSQIIKPNETRDINISREEKLGNLKFNVVQVLKYRTKFPALSVNQLKVYYRFGIFPQRFGNGFIHKKLTKEQKNQLKNIILEAKLGK